MYYHLNEIIKTVSLCIHHELYKRGPQRNQIHRSRVDLTVLTLTGFTEWLIGIAISKLGLANVYKAKREEGAWGEGFEEKFYGYVYLIIGLIGEHWVKHRWMNSWSGQEIKYGVWEFPK